MPSKVWYGITYPFPNIIGAADEVWEWIRNFIPYVIMDVITYACWYLSWTMLVKGATGDNIFWIILVSTPTGLHVLLEKKHLFWQSLTKSTPIACQALVLYCFNDIVSDTNVYSQQLNLLLTYGFPDKLTTWTNDPNVSLFLYFRLFKSLLVS